MSLPLWSVAGLQVGTDMDGLLDAPQSPILLCHFHVIPVYHMVRGGCMFSERRIVVSVSSHLPLVPWGGLPLSDVGHLDSVIFESDILGLSVSPVS